MKAAAGSHSFLQDTPGMCEGRAHFALAQSKSPWTSARSELTPNFPLRPAPADASTLGVPAALPGFGAFSPPALVPRLPQGLCTGQPTPMSPLRLCTGSPSWGGPTDPKPATLISTPRAPPAAQSSDTLFAVGGCHLCSGPPAVGCPWSSPPCALWTGAQNTCERLWSRHMPPTGRAGGRGGGAGSHSVP